MATAVSTSDCMVEQSGSSETHKHTQHTHTAHTNTTHNTYKHTQHIYTHTQTCHHNAIPSMATAVSTSDCVVEHSGSSETAAMAKGGSISRDSLNRRVLSTSWKTYDCKGM